MNREFFRRFLIPQVQMPPEPIKPGLYHYMQEHSGQYARFHLRVEPDGAGLLIMNATAAAQLTPAGVVITKGILEGMDDAQLLHELGEHFKGTSDNQLRKDLQKVRDLLGELAHPGDTYPIFNLEDATFSRYEARLLAPLEADIPLAESELLFPILGRLWEIGIPHATILVPDGPDQTHLVQVVERAEDLGLICGVSGRATDLNQGTLLDDIALAGVDHVTVFYASSKPEIHDPLFGSGDHEAVKAVFHRTQELEVADVGHVPLIQDTIHDLGTTLEALLELEVPNATFFAIATEEGSDDEGAIPARALRQVAAQVEEDATEEQVRYIWEPPVRRDTRKSFIEQVRAGPRCSGDISIRVERDGSVIPPRGPRKVAGNLLHEEWEAIWNQDAFETYRERVQAPTRCEICPGLAICAADCPRDSAGWSQGD